MSTLFIRTLRQDPADAEVPSHKLLVRAGYIRRTAVGLYSWLPLGKIVLENVARVVREELGTIGAQEVLLPALLPDQLYQSTGRLAEYGDLLFRLDDRRGTGYVLGPTHEEMFTQLVKGEYSSYRDLPLVIYQIQTKYRDETRPRSGLLRGREFLMQDSCSFDLDDAGLQKSYELHREVYTRILDRLGVRYQIATAMPGAMGGAMSEEFLAPSPAGDDTVAVCTRCDYAANAEAVEVLPPDIDATVEHPPVEVVDTPGTPTIESLTEFLDIPAAATLKNVLVKVVRPDETEIMAVGVPGDRDVDLDRLEAALTPATVEIFTEDDFAARPDLVRGYLGPQRLPADVRYFADPRVAPGTSWVTGANVSGQHARGVVCGRDFTVECYVDVATLLPGDACPHCGAALSLERAIEVGHIFQLGTKYSDAFELDVLGPDGKPTRVTMGSYGLGVSRALAVLAEQTFDEKGLCWPREVAPADVHIVGTGKEDQIHVALELGRKLQSRGLRVLVDDRPGVSPGVKFTDAELVGVPTIVVVGRTLAEGRIELRDRRSDDRQEIPVAEAVDRVAAAVSAGRVGVG